MEPIKPKSVQRGSIRQFSRLADNAAKGGILPHWGMKKAEAYASAFLSRFAYLR